MSINVGSDFSGVGAFDQALQRLGIDYHTIFSCDMDKYARKTYTLNFGEPDYYPENVYDRVIPEESLDIYMTSPPCQSFSLAGKRLGKDDKRGILFFNSHEFIKTNKPRFFIFENVKGLLSDDNGTTFQEWVNILGGKSVNGVPVMFPYEDSVPYHIYWKVLNAKDYGVPQNRERVFVIGIRDDKDNVFQFPKELPLVKRLKDVLEDEVDEKYFLSDKMLDNLTSRKDNFNNGKVNYKDENSVASTITKSSSSLDISDNILKLGNVNPSGNGMNGNVFSENGISPTLSTNKGEGIKIHTHLTDKTPIVEYQLTGGKWDKTHEQSGRVYDKNGIAPTIHTMGGGNQEPKIIDNKVIQLNQSKESGGKQPFQQNRVYDTNGIMTTLDTDSGRKSILTIQTNTKKGFDEAEEEEDSINFSVPNSETRRGRIGKGVSQTLDTQCNQGIYTQQRIRRLTPRECFRLMDFNDDFIEKTINSKVVSESQMYKQAGNSIVVNVLVEIIKKLKL